MRSRGFTLLECLTGIVVIFLIVAIAIPMYAMRVRRSEQVDVRNQLRCVWESEAAYKSLHGTYTDDAAKLENWKARTKKYQFRIRHASETRFLAEAEGDLNNDRICDDKWTINESGILANVK